MGAPIRCLDELWVIPCLCRSSTLTISSDVFMDSVNRDVSMEMMVGPSPCYVSSDETDIRPRSNLQGDLAASSSYLVRHSPRFLSLWKSPTGFPVSRLHDSNFRLSWVTTDLNTTSVTPQSMSKVSPADVDVKVVKYIYHHAEGSSSFLLIEA